MNPTDSNAQKFIRDAYKALQSGDRIQSRRLAQQAATLDPGCFSQQSQILTRVWNISTAHWKLIPKVKERAKGCIGQSGGYVISRKSE
jgi:phosphate uptake regulator